MLRAVARVGRRIFLEPRGVAQLSLDFYTLGPTTLTGQNALASWLVPGVGPGGPYPTKSNTPPQPTVMALGRFSTTYSLGAFTRQRSPRPTARPRRSVPRVLLGVLVVLAAPQSRQQKVDLPAHRLPVQIRPGCDPRIPAQPLIIAPLRLCRWRRFHTHQ